MAMERTSPVRTMQSFFQAKKAGGRAAGKAINSPDATKTPTRFSQRLASTPSQALSPLPAAVKASLPNSPATKRRRQNDEDIEQHAIFTPKKPKVSASTHSTPTKSLRKHVNKVDSAKGDKKASAFKLSETPNPPTSLTFEPVLSPVKANPSIAPVTPEGKQIPSAAIQSRPSLRSLRRDSTEFVKIADKEATASIQVNDDLIHDPHEFAGSPSIKDSHGQISQSKTIRILSTSTTKITSSTPTPAFQKYRHLVTPGRKLLLPTKYEMLEKMFHGLEYTVMFMKGRDQPCIYHKIRKPVENMCHRNFEMSHLAKIRTVYPEAYTYKGVHVMDMGVSVASVCIDIPQPATEEAGKDKSVDIKQDPEPTEKPKSSPSIVRGGTFGKATVSAVDSASLREKALGTSKAVGERRKEFHERLVQLIRQQHDKFLQTLDHIPPALDAELRAWHPQFDLENVPEIEPAPMPELKDDVVDFRTGTRSVKVKSETSSEITESIKDTGASIKHEIGTPGKRELAPPQTPPVVSTKSTPSDAVPSSTPTKPKSRASALLERIREKERKRVEQEMYTPKLTPADIRRRAMLSRLGDLAQAITFMYVSANKNVLPMAQVAQQMSTSLNAALSEQEAKDHILLLAETVPEFCTVKTLELGAVVRIDRTVPVKRVREKVSAILAK